jgi:Fic family protein
LLLELQQQYRERMQKASQSSSVLKLVDRLFSSPFVTITGVAGLLSVTYRAATKNVEKLVEQQILQETDPTRKTRRVYYAREVVELLNRPSM